MPPLASLAAGERKLFESTVASGPVAAENVAAAIRGLGAYILAGCGAGATMAAELARRAEDDEAGLEGLVAVILLGAALGEDPGISRRVGVLQTPALLVAPTTRSRAAPIACGARSLLISCGLACT